MKLLTLFIDKLRNMRIVQKLVIGYILFICIPFIIFAFLFYRQMVNNLYEQYKTDQIQFVEQAYHNFKIEISKIESIFPLYQNNKNLIEYIGGYYKSDWEMIYNYQRFIKPTFSFTYLGNPVVEDITIYKQNIKALQIEPIILNIKDFENQDLKDNTRKLPPNQGMWTYDRQEDNSLPIIHYTHKLNNESYTKELGLLHVTVNNRLLNTLFQSLEKEKSWVWLLDENLTPIYQERVPKRDNTKLKQVVLDNIDNQQMKNFYENGHQLLINIIPIHELGLTFVNISNIEPLANMKETVSLLLGSGILLLIFLSFVYFMVASSIALRITRFSDHLKQVPELKYANFTETSNKDEVGYLISSYNTMVNRVVEMENQMYHNELLKKDAEIKMLQAQINPHFLYNTLESIRMMAFANNDNELSEVIYTLGKLLRYSVSNNEGEITLQDEVDNILDYIAIHKIRMGDRLQFKLRVNAKISDFSCPKFILQPIVENSIQHGISKSRKQGSIQIDICENSSQIIIKIYNSGAPITEERLIHIRKILSGNKLTRKGKHGIGLINVQERIKSFFGEDSGVFVEEGMNQGTVFELHLAKRGAAEHAKINDCR